MINRNQVEECFTKTIEYAYPVYEIGYNEKAHTVLSCLDSYKNLYSIGRNGGFNYVGMIDCVDIGLTTVEHILHKKSKKDWIKLREHFSTYSVVD